MREIYIYSPKIIRITSCLFNLRATSNNTDKTVFCECYSHLHELRALVPSANILVNTATAKRYNKYTIGSFVT